MHSNADGSATLRTLEQKKLTDCPSNLKEAIDWILRVTGKDGGGDQTNGSDGLITAVQGLLRTAGVENNNPKISINKDLIDNLADGLAKFIGYDGNGTVEGTGIAGVPMETGNKKHKEGKPFTSGEMSNYKSGYVYSYEPKKATWSEGNKDVGAKIFLGCLPMIFSALSYLYWRCDIKGNGEWRSYKLKGGQDLNHFMLAIGYADDVVQNTAGSQVASSACGGFGELSKAMSAAEPFNKAITYSTFTKELRNRVGECKNDFNKCPLSALSVAAETYFRHQQDKERNDGIMFPQTIRDILYWLSALQFSPQYVELEKHIDSLFSGGSLDVTMTGLSATTLSANDVKTHLLTTCQYAPVLLGLIQGDTDSTKKGGTPWQYEMFSNSKFRFTYPAGRALFYTLADYVYAIHFQLYFLYLQCANYYRNGCGWFLCRYGESVHPLDGGNNLTSHICAAYTCSGGECTHESGKNGDCEHEGKKGGKQCGSNNNSPSPLQAFLTDKLESLKLGASNSYSQHMKQHPEDYMCHVKMGFDAAHLRKEERKGSDIYYALRPFCNSAHNPIRRLCETLIFLTRRAPNTLGEVFGFYCQLVQEWDTPSRPSSSIKTAIRGTVESVIASLFKYPTDATKSLISSVSSLVSHCHKISGGQIQHFGPGGTTACTHTNAPTDLYSLQSCDGKAGSQNNNKKCGTYLYPVTYCAGATFAPKFAYTYLSWIVDFAHDLQSRLKAFLDEFNALKCLGCGKCGQGSSHITNNHGDLSACGCKSIPQCADDLPLFYAHGFQFMSANKLKNGTDGRGANKRECYKFATQLKNVTAGEPLSEFLKAIDVFLFCLRLPFLLLIASLWTLTAITLLYNYLFKLDLLHIKSHLHLPSSHKILPSALFTAGKASALKKLFHYMT
ncbi:variant erythrocyte surface antigen-1 family protein [Babesia caballi]|uniref:Variant erythrocyte surface antigen-1 family protein n=1 Tax=Babesia caballi TaxID=5871 RepID=A0AAV4LPP6_BABCB|nr:variant erythrocyte surface antigen-1 family protein [Babesia caballi]